MPTTVTVENQIIHVVTAGVPGPPGISPPGSDANYIHDQPVPASVWNINHNLNKLPTVAIVDTSDTVVEGTIVYVDNDNLTVSFNAIFAGKAVLN